MWAYIFLAVGILFFIVILVMGIKIAGLKKERNQMEGALNSIELPVVIFDGSDSCIFSNPSAKKLLEFVQKGKHSELVNRCETLGFELLTALDRASQIKACVCVDKKKAREEKAAHEAELIGLKESHEKEVKWLTNILDSIRTPISVTNNDKKWTFVNRAAAQILGAERQDIIGKSYSNWGKYIGDIAEEASEGVAQNGAGTYFSQFDEKFHVAVSEVYDENNMLEGYVEVVRSVIDSPSETVEFEDKTYWYEIILDAVPFPVCVTDAHGIWVFMNKAAEEVIGFTRQEAVGKPCNSWGSSICNTDKCSMRCAEEGKRSTEIDYEGKRFRIDVDRLLDQKGREIGFMEIFLDKTFMHESQAEDIEFLDGLRKVIISLVQSAKGIDEGASELAGNSTKQAQEITALCESVSDVADKTKDNTELAGKSSSLADVIKENAEKGSVKMDKLAQAVEDIDASIQAISKVFRFIDDIAFQTNILALNAAVEAARAGQHGKGFAVVAEEVRNLAAKSAASAKDTGTLITDSIDKARMGVQIAAETAESFKEIVSGIDESSRIAKEILTSSKNQDKEIVKINVGIDQVTQGVQKNTAMSEESAAASAGMSRDIVKIQELVDTYSESLINFYKFNITEG